MKKVLVVITTSMVSYGGLATVALNYYRNMNNDNIRIDFMSSNALSDDLAKELSDGGSKYIMLPSRKKHPFKYIINYCKIIKSYDVVHVHANSATATIELFPAKIENVPKRIVHIHNSTCSHKILHFFLKPIFDLTYTDAIACSRKAGNWIFGKNNFKVYNNAINIHKFEYSDSNRKSIRNENNISKEDIVVGHVGKMVEQKNHVYLIELFERLHEINPKFKLMLVGDGVLRNEIEALIRKKGLESFIILVGMKADASSYYSAFDFFVFPSKWEGLPLSLLEAQAAGLKCFASDLITDEVDMAGRIKFLSFNDPVQTWCDEIINDLCYNREEESKINIEGLNHNNYNITKVANDLLNLYLRE